jgi:hypothetical protein
VAPSILQKKKTTEAGMQPQLAACFLSGLLTLKIEVI